MRPSTLALLAALATACAAEAGGAGHDTVTLPTTGGMARFVLPEVPPTGASSGSVPEVVVHLVFDGAGSTFGLVGPHPVAGVTPAGSVEPDPAGGLVLGAFAHALSLPIDGPSPGRRSGWDSLDVERVELAPLDDDGDGFADRLRATFAGTATHFAYDYWNEERPFASRVEAVLLPPTPAAPELATAAVVPIDPLSIRFELPAELTAARIRTSAGDIPVSWTGADRTLALVPALPLPWGETVSVVGEARVAGTGGATGPFELPIPVIAGPSAPWVESFEDPSLAGFVAAGWQIRSAAESHGLPPLDGDRYLLVGNSDFRLLFEIEVPDTDAPVLRFDARFAFRTTWDRHALPIGAVEVAAAGVPRAKGWFGWASDQIEVPLEGSVYAGVSATEEVEVALAALRGKRAIVSLAGKTRAGSGGFNDDPLPADGDLQLDGLRVVP